MCSWGRKSSAESSKSNAFNRSLRFQFNLTVQQDAAEAFLDLVPSYHSLPELCSSSCRIITPRTTEDLNEQERWQQNFVGPFDGMVRCSLEDCKEFTVAEQVENYHHANCWHIAGIRYLSSIGGNEADIEKLRICTEQDLCDCRTTFREDMFPWSDKFSYIARAPKILCIHLKWVSVNFFGQLVKLQGHVLFPIILDLSSFMTSEVAIKTRDEIFLRRQAYERHQKPSLHTEISNIQYNTQEIEIKCLPQQQETSTLAVHKTLTQESNFNQTGGCSKAMLTDSEMQRDELVS